MSQVSESNFEKGAEACSMFHSARSILEITLAIYALWHHLFLFIYFLLCRMRCVTWMEDGCIPIWCRFILFFPIILRLMFQSSVNRGPAGRSTYCMCNCVGTCVFEIYIFYEILMQSYHDVVSIYTWNENAELFSNSNVKRLINFWLNKEKCVSAQWSLFSGPHVSYTNPLPLTHTVKV